VTVADLGKARKHASHRLVVESLGTVDDDDVHSQRLAEVFHCLRLPGARRTLRRPALVKVQRRRQRYVAPGK